MKKIKSRSGFKNKKLFAAGLVVFVLTGASGLLARGQGPGILDSALPPPHFDAAKELAMKIPETFTFAAVGDINMRHPISQLDNPHFQALINVMRAADMTYADLEQPIIDDTDPNYHGPRGVHDRSVIEDLKFMGIRVVTTANNNAKAGGNDGIFLTIRLLDEAGITYAGTGKDITEARQAQYGSTPKGSIGVVGTYAMDPGSWPPDARVSDARNNWPGVNPLHVTPYNVVTADQMESLRKIREASYAHRSEVNVPVAPVPPGEGPNELFLMGSWFKVGDKTGGLNYKMDRSDLAGIIQSIRYGKQKSDFMIVAVHCHQNSFSYQAYSHDNSTPDFLIELAHLAIDSGADVFVGTGVHTMRGVEIYKGKPIFYGVGNFFIHSEPSMSITDPSYRPPAQGEYPWGGAITVPTAGYAPSEHNRDIWAPDNMEAMLTTSRYEGGKLVEVRLYPADLGIDGTRPLSEVGTPLEASPEMAQRILKHVQDMSKPFGTTISIENNVGVIRVAQTGTDSK